MPQMQPMNWMFLPPYFIIMLAFMLSMMFFSIYFTKYMNKTSNKIKNYQNFMMKW